DENMGGIRRDDIFLRPERKRHHRHPVGFAAKAANVIALAAFGLVRKAVFQNLGILWRQRGLLAESPWLGLVEGRLAAKPWDNAAGPLALQIGEHGLVEYV